jgi:hypothetical protein
LKVKQTKFLSIMKDLKSNSNNKQSIYLVYYLVFYTFVLTPQETKKYPLDQ